jgi:hypothetical protein
MTAGPLSVRPHVRTDSKAGAGAGENDEYRHGNDNQPIGSWQRR